MSYSREELEQMTGGEPIGTQQYKLAIQVEVGVNSIKDNHGSFPEGDCGVPWSFTGRFGNFKAITNFTQAVD